jgi:hypothetical protein
MLNSSKFSGRTFDANFLREEMQVNETQTYLGNCSLDEIKRLEKEGFKVENFNQDVEEIDITRLF